MIILDYDKVLVQLWTAEQKSLEMLRMLKQSGKLLSDIPPDSYLWTGTKEELVTLLKTIEQVINSK